MSAPIAYRICPAKPAAHVFEVTLTVEEPAADGRILGRHQVPPSETDPIWLKAAGIDLLRRLSGGGAVFQFPQSRIDLVEGNTVKHDQLS